MSGALPEEHGLEIEKIRELIRMLENSSLSEIEIEESGRRIKLKKPAPEVVASPTVVQALPHLPEYAAPAHVVHAPAPSEPAPAAAPTAAESGLVTVDSPMVGVFYSAPAPGEPPFVKPGDDIKKDQPLCIVEAMKLMNEVTAKFAGVIVRCLVENGEPVEFGQPLFQVRPIDAH